VVFDFGAGRAVTTGEGGVVCTDDDALAERLRACVEHRLSDIACAVGIAQLEKLPRMLTMRREVAADYTRMLASVPGVEIPCADVGQRQRGWSTYLVRLAAGIDRDRIIEQLRVQGIEVAPGVPAIHRASARIDAAWVPVAIDVAGRTLALPLYPHLSPHQQQRVVTALDLAVRAA
jgi:perosamine synthetase